MSLLSTAAKAAVASSVHGRVQRRQQTAGPQEAAAAPVAHVPVAPAPCCSRPVAQAPAAQALVAAAWLRRFTAGCRIISRIDDGN